MISVDKLLRVCDRIVLLASGEWVLRYRGNGGVVIFLRSALITVTLTVLAAISCEILRPSSIWWTFDPTRIRGLAFATSPWLAPVFAGAYAALYARFAAQWSYLAGLHNQIMAAAMASSPTNRYSQEVLARWQAGFVEDAEDLHLALKPMFAVLIESMFEKEAVRKFYDDYAPGGKTRRERLQIEIRSAASSREKA